MLEAIKALLRSRKFLLAVVGVVQVLVLDAFGVDPALWEAILAVIMVLIGMIAVEDAAQKFNSK